MTMTYRSAGTALTNAQIDSNIKTVEHRYNGIPIASAATLTLDNEYNYFVVTGGVTMTGLPDVSAGFRITCKFSGAPLLTHSATFIMPGGVDIQAAANDVAVFEQEDTGTQVWRCVSYTYAANALETYVTQANSNNSTKVATTEYVDNMGALLGDWKLVESYTIALGTTHEFAYRFTTEPSVFRINFSGLIPSGTITAVCVKLGFDNSYGCIENGAITLFEVDTYGTHGNGCQVAKNAGAGDLNGYIEFTRLDAGFYSYRGMSYDSASTYVLQEFSGTANLTSTNTLYKIKLVTTTNLSVSGQMDLWVAV